ncbi:MAG: MGMT family protein [Thermomicrobiales bacterium]
MTENPTDPKDFAERVYAVVDAIPYGRVTTYGLIARALGSPRSARIVGGALLRTPDGRSLPAHRVVNRQGFLSGGWHFGHPDIMRDRLLAEGVPFKDLDGYIVDITKVLWDPSADPAIDRLYRKSGTAMADDELPDIADDLDGDAPFRIVDVTP